MAKSAPTLVFYMGRRFAGEIANVLIAGGRDVYEPAAIVANAARPDQSVIVTTLGGLAAAAETSPALSIIVIGENVKLAKELNWLAAASADYLARKAPTKLVSGRSTSSCFG